MDLKALSAEIKSDPLRLGYAACKSNAEVVALLNAPRDKALASITASELWGCTILEELLALAEPNRYTYMIMIMLGTIDVKAGRSLESLLGLFDSKSQTRATIVALVGKPLKESRAEALGLGLVAEGYVGKALAQWGASNG
jgi:hypothetical protein